MYCVISDAPVARDTVKDRKLGLFWEPLSEWHNGLDCVGDPVFLAVPQPVAQQVKYCANDRKVMGSNPT